MKKMKVILILLPVLLLLLVCAIPSFDKNLTPSVYSAGTIPRGAMRMIAHTGYSAVAPGNTLPAYEAATSQTFLFWDASFLSMPTT